MTRRKVRRIRALTGLGQLLQVVVGVSGFLGDSDGSKAGLGYCS
jgi:hypothetical protein